MRTTPPHVIAYRSVISLITLLIIVSVALGLAGHGPLTVLHQIAGPLYRGLDLDRISG